MTSQPDRPAGEKGSAPGPLPAPGNPVPGPDERYRQLVELSPEAIHIQCDGRIVFANRATLRLLGACDPSEVLGRPVLDFIHPEHREFVAARIAALREARVAAPHFEERYLRLDGGVVDVEVAAAPFEYEGRPAAQVIVRDISVRKQAETALRDSEAQYRALVETTGTGFVVLDAGGRVLDANQEYVRLTGHARLGDILGRSVVEWTATCHQEKNARAVEQCVRDGFVRNLEIDYVSGRGKLTPVEINATVVPKDGQPRILSLCRDISERRGAEEARHEYEVRLGGVVESTADGLLVVDRDGRVIIHNSRFAEMWRIPRELVELGDDEPLLSCVMEQVSAPEAFLSRVRELYASDAEDKDEIKFKDGRTFERYSRPLLVEGRIAGRVWSFRDITGRIRAEQALRESEERYRALFEGAGDAILLMREGRFVGCNPRALEMFGCLEREKLVGRAPHELSPALQPDGRGSREMAGEKIAAALAGKPQFFEWAHVRFDGTAFPAEVSLSRVRLSDGLWLQAMVRDISERKRAEAALRDSEARFKSVFEEAHLGIVITSPSYKFERANPAFCRMMGYSEEELTSMTFADITHPEHLDQDRRLVGQVGRGELPFYQTEKRYIGKNGQVLWGSLLVSSIRDERGDLRYYLSMVNDITERKRAEAELRAERDLSESMFRTAQVIMLMLDVDGRIVTFNPYMAELCGYRPEEARGRDWFETFLPEDCRDRVRQTFATVIEKHETRGGQNPIITRDGRQRLFEWSSRTLRDHSGRTAGVLAVGQDITERHRAEEEVRSLARIPEESPNPVLRVSREGRVLYANSASAPLLAGVLAGEEAASGFLPALVAEALDEGANKAAEVDAAGRVFEVLIAPAPDAGHVNVYGRDITDRRRLQTEQREYARRLEAEVAERTREIRISEERYRALFENVDHAIVTTDLDGALLSANPAARQLFAWEQGVRPGGGIAGLFAEPEPGGRRDEVLERARSGAALSHECVGRSSDGREMPLHLSISPLRGADGRPSALIWVITDLSERERLTEEVQRAQEYAGIVLRRSGPGSELIGEGPAHRRIAGFIRSAAEASAPVLVLGESGVGKEVVARAVHLNSPRAEGPFVVVDCAALTGSLLESELFGHEKGAFTGAAEAKAGLVEIADGGTLFVDEIGEMPLELQSTLLRVLERGEFRRVGSVRERRADLRVVAATNRDLAAEVKAGRFRADLYFRLNVLSFTVPPLRERLEDVPALAAHFLKHSRVTAPAAKRLRADALRCLKAYDWPGNIRELANVVERAVIISGRTEAITPEHLPPELRRPVVRSAARDGAASMAEAERSAIAAALESSGGNKSRAAGILGITRATLRAKMVKYGLASDRKA